MLVCFAMASALGGLLYRLIDLSIINRAFLLKQSDARILRTVNIPGFRGIILDRLGSPLAVSASVQSVWVNPKSFKATHRQIRKIARILHMSYHHVVRKVRKKGGREFAYLKRAVPPSVANRIRLLKIPGVFFQREYRRFYPEGEVTAHVVGFTDIDDKGQEGIELVYNPWLRGSPGKKEVLKDRLGNIITEIALLKKPTQGKNVQYQYG